MRVLLTIIVVVLGYVTYHSFIHVPPKQQVWMSTNGVDTITLLHVGFPGKIENSSMHHGPIFDLGRATDWTGFERVNYKDRTYVHLGSGAFRSQPRDKATSRYTVREMLKPRRDGRWPYASILEVIDNTNGDVLARREWWRPASNDRNKTSDSRGWDGSKASIFVQELLNPSAPMRQPTDRKYPPTNTELTSIEPPQRAVQQQYNGVSGCAPDYLIGNDGGAWRRIRLITPEWEYATKEHVRQTICVGENIFVFSQEVAYTQYIDHLNLDGELLGQYELRGPGPHVGLTNAPGTRFVIDFEFSESSMKAHYVYVYNYSRVWEEPEFLPDEEAVFEVQLAKRK